MKTLGRLIEGIRIQRQIPGSKLVTSGPYNNRMASQAEVAKRTAVLLGVDESSVLVQSEPQTTYEEALIYHERFYNGERLIVVTTAAHMPRALLEFQRLGIDVLPSPTNYTYRGIHGLRFTLMPSPAYIDHLRLAIYEYAAMVRNHIREQFRG